MGRPGVAGEPGAKGETVSSLIRNINLSKIKLILKQNVITINVICLRSYDIILLYSL